MLSAAPVYCAGLLPVALAPMPPLVDMLTIIGFVAFPAVQEGTATAERVTMTSAGAADGQPGLIMMVEVGVVEFWLGCVSVTAYERLLLYMTNEQSQVLR
jgi:hypothetical protein